MTVDDLQQMDDQSLKAMAYDMVSTIGRAKANLEVIEAELRRRTQVVEVDGVFVPGEPEPSAARLAKPQRAKARGNNARRATETG